jgi:hypothetical protein
MPVILAIWEAEIGRIMIQGQSGQKVWETPTQPIARCGGLGKITRERRAGGVAQVVECLCEALSSNCNTTRKK